jgi:formate dehydrogenase accessory protein FdhD
MSSGHDIGSKAARRVTGVVWAPGLAGVTSAERFLPEEIAVSICVNGRPIAVVIATPGDYADLGLGFAITEGLVARPEDVQECLVATKAAGVRVDVRLTTQAAMAAAPRERTLPGRSSCGLCGLSQLKQAIRPVRPVAPGGEMDPAALHNAFAELHLRQPLNEETRAVHAAAHVLPDGRFTEIREDIGRHNALDKLIGALARTGANAADGAVLLTSRASYEMVDKAAAAGVRILAAISAPSALALRKAETAGLTLVGVARRDSFVVFTGRERLGVSLTPATGGIEHG